MSVVLSRRRADAVDRRRMTSVPRPVHDLLVTQGGLARRRDLRSAGLRRRLLERLLRDGDGRNVGGDVVSLRTDRPQDEGLRAAVLGLNGCASGASAASVWGIELVEDSATRDVTVGRNRGGATWPGTTVRRRDLAVEDCTVVDGLRVTTALRTVLDLARALPLDEAVAAADSALRRELVTVEQLVAAVAATPAARGRPDLVRVVALVDRESGSVLESLCRVLLVLAGLAPPETQYVVRGRDGRFVGRVDFAWPDARLVVEVDGFAFHSEREQYRADRRRGNALVLSGWRVLRFGWEDVRHHPDLLVEQVRAALLV